MNQRMGAYRLREQPLISCESRRSFSHLTPYLKRDLSPRHVDLPIVRLPRRSVRADPLDAGGADNASHNGSGVALFGTCSHGAKSSSIAHRAMTALISDAGGNAPARPVISLLDHTTASSMRWWTPTRRPCDVFLLLVQEAPASPVPASAPGPSLWGRADALGVM
jgi:hypothetical protein